MIGQQARTGMPGIGANHAPWTWGFLLVSLETSLLANASHEIRVPALPVQQGGPSETIFALEKGKLSLAHFSVIGILQYKDSCNPYFMKY